ncbi:MAG: imidazole glycerol phosphate synthase subunit HisH [Ruminococcus sp.]|nr:imidazole glycerol phosphate synthase subunit HisH [Ruminococcus sp.]
MIAVIDYGGGNIQSVYKALKFIGCECKITCDKNEIINADGAILPGQGSFGDCVESMRKNGIDEAVNQFINSGKPFLGICVGLQLLFENSEETPETAGLGIFKGKIKKIPNGEGLKIPHMGWNSIRILNNEGIFSGIEDNSYVYFVHSYYLDAEDKNIVSAQTEYGVKIDAAVCRGNVTATQFHPEKSGDTGLKMLRNFANMCEVK